MPRKTYTRSELASALAVAADVGHEPPPAREDMAMAVRVTLGVLAQRHPGKTVEIRVPPFAAAQVLPGLRHTRGTPPNVIETDPRTWLALMIGRCDWSDAVADGSVRASGTRADLTALLPLRIDGGGIDDGDGADGDGGDTAGSDITDERPTLGPTAVE